jgi:hypothetical protein
LKTAIKPTEYPPPEPIEPPYVPVSSSQPSLSATEFLCVGYSPSMVISTI